MFTHFATLSLALVGLDVLSLGFLRITEEVLGVCVYGWFGFMVLRMEVLVFFGCGKM